MRQVAPIRTPAIQTHRFAAGLLRDALLALTALFLLPTTIFQARAQNSSPRAVPAPIERRSPPAQPAGQHTPAHPGNQRSLPQQQHLAQWMDSHRALPLDQQQRALSAEPGFRSLQPQVQQRMHDRLTQLNTMAPAERQRTIDRTEAMERLTPPQRQQVRGAMQQLGNLPEDRRHAVARTFRSLRDVPEPQRGNYLNSPQLRSQFSDEERGTLNHLLEAAPYLPPASAPSRPPR